MGSASVLVCSWAPWGESLSCPTALNWYSGVHLKSFQVFPESLHLFEIICVCQYKYAPAVTKGLTTMLDFKESVRGAGQLSREGLRAWGQKPSAAGIPAQVKPHWGAASLAPAGKNLWLVKTLHLSYYSINTPVTESHFQRPPLQLVLPGLLWKVFTEIWGNPGFWQCYGRVELHCCLSAFCERVKTNILGGLPCSHPALTCWK